MGMFYLTWPRLLVHLCILANFSSTILANDGAWTSKHEEGRCAIRGECGKKSFFGGQLPCPDNGLAQNPDHDTRKKLIAICGDKWSTGDVCCNEAQVSFGEADSNSC